MTETIKRNIDLISIAGIGLFLLILSIMGVYESTSVDYVSAATTSAVTVSAIVAQSESLTVTLVNNGVAVNAATTTVTTTATSTPLGTLSVSANTIAAHTLTMTTNANGGYTVNTKYDHVLQSTASTTKNIDDWTGTNAAPTVISGAGAELFGYTTEDPTLAGTGATSTRFTSGKWAKFTTGDLEVAYHSGPVNATTTKVGYQAGISVSTAAATDYGCTVTYTMTSAF